MGNAVQVDPDVLAAGARRLADIAGTLDTLAGGVLGLCARAAAVAGAGELPVAVDGVGREMAGAVGRLSGVVDDLGTRTAQSGDDYRLVEQALASRWAAR